MHKFTQFSFFGGCRLLFFDCLNADFLLEMRDIALDGIRVVFHALLKCFEDLLIFFGCTVEDILLLGLQLFDCVQDLRGHVVNLSLLFESFND